MKKQQREQSTGTYKNNKTNNSNSGENQLAETKPIKDTPFTAVKLDKTWFLTLGKYRLTEPLQTHQQVEKAAKDASWERIMQIIKIMIIEHEQEKNKPVNNTEIHTLTKTPD